ncbi:Protein asteroid [Habropoda laboriosa]|uniref:Protein asteroid n=1 Tax=Habropoda laboriosa TaxID=597456 RepID=A0A0L7R8M1_9HYME|nr:Protein asteroid [Habropoda laboriosa]
MGIPGLTSYINNRSDRYLEYYELCDSYLVIDGNSIACLLHNLHAKCNCAFGGDYDNVAQCVSDFFDDLLKCNVTPLVLMDGGIENKKLKTIINRTKEKIRIASCFCPLSQQKMSFFPLFLMEVFKDVMVEKNIRYVQCLFEADSDIAAVARILNCPVLSYDSDFYIYGTLYIPFNTLDNYITKSSTGKGYVKRCKIYRVEHLLSSFKGFNQSMLPLVAILLGNDYVKRGTFRNFFRHLKLKGASRKRHNLRQRRIEATFTWLSNYTLDKAIIGILSRLAKPIRQRMLDLIETNINGYTNVSAEVLVPLGLPKDYVARVNTHHLNRIFKFDGDINTLTYIEETHGEEDNETSEEEGEEGEEDETEIINTLDDSESMFENAAVSNLPVWFVNDFFMAKYPGYFIDLILRCLYICPIQVEDYCYPSSIVISLKIISVIFGILKSGINDRVHYLKYMIRGQNKKIICRELEGMETIFSYKLPSLFNLKEVPLIIRREILDNTLGIANMNWINDLPPEWMLYVGCIKYWIEQSEPPISYKYYIYSIFVCMLFSKIDLKIRRHRNMYNFQNKYGKIIQGIEIRRKATNYKPQYVINGTITEACNALDRDDCLLAAPFFISHFEMDKKLYTNPKKYNRSIVHAFAEFQSCLRYSMNLNALLGYPYPQTKVANLFNGTLLYNLSNNFKIRYDIEGYINIIFRQSPSLLRLFHTILLKGRTMFSLLLQNETNHCRKQKVRSKNSKFNKHSAESDAEYFSAEENLHEPIFYDANNPFSLLT